MKKITFFTYNAYTSGGTERVMTMIANELSKKYQVEIVSMMKNSEAPFYNIDKKIKIIDLNLENTEPLIIHFPFLSAKIKKSLKDYKTDVVVCVGMRYVPVSIFFNKKFKYIAWEHYNSFVNKKFSVADFGRRIASKKADKIVVLTDKDRQNNIKMFKTNPNKIVKIYNPTNSNSIKGDYDVDSKLLLSCGRITGQKGFDYLVEIAKIVFKKHEDWKWHIYGDGPDKEKIESLIKENELEENVILMGQTDKMLELYKDYSMYVMTSRFEGFPMVNIEAHSAKLPIVSFDCPCGPSEMILDGENGYIVDCFDIDKMAEKINYLIDHPEVRKKMSDNTGKDKEKLKMENIIKEWEKIFK